jgi:hypothetical protein
MSRPKNYHFEGCGLYFESAFTVIDVEITFIKVSVSMVAYELVELHGSKPILVSSAAFGKYKCPSRATHV